MRKTKLFSLLMLLFVGITSVWADKITDYTNIVSGQKYYIGATLSNSTDYYFKANGGTDVITTGTYGTCASSTEDATPVIITISGTTGTIQFESGNYLHLPSASSPNGKYLSSASSQSWTFSNEDGKIRLMNNGRALQRNNNANTDRFGSYGSTQTDVWLEPAAVISTVTIGSHANGSISITGAADLSEVEEGTELTVTATPDAENHYIGGTIKVVKTGVTPEADVTTEVLSGSTLTMPAYAITVSATFTPTYAINLVANGGSIALDYTKGGAADGYAIAGTTISAEATADDAHVFASLTVSENVTEPTIVDNLAEFVMPAEAVTITATFDEKSTPTINVDEEVLAFGEVDLNSTPVPLTFNVSGVALAKGQLTITSNNAAFTVSPTSIDIDGTLAATEITVTPVTTTANTFNGKITISGGNAEAKEVTLSLTVNKLAAGISWAEDSKVGVLGDAYTHPTFNNPNSVVVELSSSDENVAYFDEGNIVLKAAGTTIITATSVATDVYAQGTASYTLTVKKKYKITWHVCGKADQYTYVVDGNNIDPIPDPTLSSEYVAKTFTGWLETELEATDDTPDFVDFTNLAATADEEYYAVFASGTPGATDYTELTDVSKLKAGDNLVVTDGDSKGMKAYDGTSNNCKQANITISEGKITSLGDACELVLGGSEDAWTLFDGTYYLYAAGTSTSGSNYLKGKTVSDDACLWTIAIDEVKAVNNTKVPYMRYNSGSSLFSCYTSNSSQSDITLYHKDAASYSQYTTNVPKVPTAVENVESSAKAVKVLKNGILLIEKANKTYNAQGQLVK